MAAVPRPSFKPEFLNRLDEIVQFASLGEGRPRPHRRPAARAAGEAAGGPPDQHRGHRRRPRLAGRDRLRPGVRRASAASADPDRHRRPAGPAADRRRGRRRRAGHGRRRRGRAQPQPDGIGPMPTDSPTLERPRQVTLAGWLIVVGSVLVVLSAFERMSGLHSLETQEAIADFLSQPPGDELGLSRRRCPVGAAGAGAGGGGRGRGGRDPRLPGARPLAQRPGGADRADGAAVRRRHGRLRLPRPPWSSSRW